MNKTIIEGFKNRVELLQGDVTRLTAEDSKNKIEIGKLQGTIGEKDKQMIMMKELITNRNPKMETLIQQMTEAFNSGIEQQKQSAQYMKDSMLIFKQILVFMQKIDEVGTNTSRGTEILEKQEQRHDDRVRHKKGSEVLDENK